MQERPSRKRTKPGGEVDLEKEHVFRGERDRHKKNKSSSRRAEQKRGKGDARQLFERVFGNLETPTPQNSGEMVERLGGPAARKKRYS